MTEAGIRVVFAIAARDRAALDIAPLMPKDLPEAIRKRSRRHEPHRESRSSTSSPARSSGLA